MKYGKFEQSYIEQYLQSFASLDSFYVFRAKGFALGLIHYFDDGESWSLMEDDDELAAACIAYLEERGAPTFEDVEQLKTFEENRLSRG